MPSNRSTPAADAPAGFHTTTAYAILRHNGVEIGKADFIGALD